MAYTLGQWDAQCDRCGHTFLSGKIRQEWNGLRVCHGPGTNGCWEPRHPQDTLRGRRDDQAPPWVRPRQDGDENNTTTPDDL